MKLNIVTSLYGTYTYHIQDLLPNPQDDVDTNGVIKGKQAVQCMRNDRGIQVEDIVHNNQIKVVG